MGTRRQELFWFSFTFVRHGSSHWLRNDYFQGVILVEMLKRFIISASLKSCGGCREGGGGREVKGRKNTIFLAVAKQKFASLPSRRDENGAF